MNRPPDIVHRREMGITHAELFRLLPGVLGPAPRRREDGRIAAAIGPGSVEIRFSDERERRIARIRLPVTHLEFRFSGCPEAAADAFMRRFDRVFHKGGG